MKLHQYAPEYVKNHVKACQKIIAEITCCDSNRKETLLKELAGLREGFLEQHPDSTWEAVLPIHSCLGYANINDGGGIISKKSGYAKFVYLAYTSDFPFTTSGGYDQTPANVIGARAYLEHPTAYEGWGETFPGRSLESLERGVRCGNDIGAYLLKVEIIA